METMFRFVSTKTTKTCSVCHKDLNLTLFYKSRKQCKGCYSRIRSKKQMVESTTDVQNKEDRPSVVLEQLSQSVTELLKVQSEHLEIILYHDENISKLEEVIKKQDVLINLLLDKK